jgi:Helicase HerA, central domain
MSLRIAENLELPPEAITQTFAILAKRGVGKTYTASVFVEEIIKAKLPVVVIDPIGVWWGLRAAADGVSAGLPIVIAGGDHADIPITPGAGEAVARLVVEQNLSLVIDLSTFRKAEQHQFMTDFAEALYHLNREARHLVLDEADAFAPQRPQPGEQRMLGAMEDIVRRGRARGLGVTLITQRSAALNKNVLTQAEVLVTLRLISPQDRAAVDEWVKAHGTPEQRDEMMKSLPSLPVGTAWFWSPGWLNGLFQRVKVRKRETFDSSSTPKVGEGVRLPARLATVDLEAIRLRLAAVVEETESDDPKQLRRQVRELRAQLGRQQPREVVRTVEVPVLRGDELARLQAATEYLAQVAGEIQEAVSRVAQQPSAPAAEAKAPVVRAPETESQAKRPTVQAAPIEGEPNHALIEGWRSRLNEGEQRILDTLVNIHPMPLTKAELALRSHYTPRGGAFEGRLSRLKRSGLIEFDGKHYRASVSLFSSKSAA